MKISQEGWDSLWERSTGFQKRMFDESGNRPEPDPEMMKSAMQALAKYPLLPMKIYWDGVWRNG